MVLALAWPSTVLFRRRGRGRLDRAPCFRRRRARFPFIHLTLEGGDGQLGPGQFRLLLGDRNTSALLYISAM